MTILSTQPPTATPDDLLVGKINAAHHAAENAAHAALGHALEAGRMLAEARSAIPHGGWEQWLAANFDGSARTARVYLRLHEHRDRLQNGSALPVSIREAARLTTERRTPPPMRNEDRFTPPPGKAIVLQDGDFYFCVIVPHVNEGYFFVAALEEDCMRFIGAIVRAL